MIGYRRGAGMRFALFGTRGLLHHSTAATSSMMPASTQTQAIVGGVVQRAGRVPTASPRHGCVERT